MENALYYTFSTIAQALAAAMALLAAFTLYRLQSIDTQCVGAAENLRIANIVTDPAILAHANLHEWQKYVGAVRKRVPVAPSDRREIYEGVLTLLPRLIRQAAAIRRVMWISLGLTAIVMGASVWALAEVPMLCVNHWAGAALYWAVMGFAACLIAYLGLLLTAFRNLPE
jgi:hypothetical protein